MAAPKSTKDISRKQLWLGSGEDSLLDSLFAGPTEPATLRATGELLLLVSIVSWSVLVVIMLAIERVTGSGLPVAESIIGIMALAAFLRWYPREWPASSPSLHQAVVVYIFAAASMGHESGNTLAPVWIAAWAGLAACVTTLALGFLNALFLVISGTLLLNILVQWQIPGAPNLVLASGVGLAVAGVIGLITHAVCFQLTRANTEARQLDRLRRELMLDFGNELRQPLKRLADTEAQGGDNPRDTLQCAMLAAHYTAVAALLSQESAATETRTLQAVAPERLIDASCRWLQTAASAVGGQLVTQMNVEQERRLTLPVLEASNAIAFLARLGLLQSGGETVKVNMAVHEAAGSRDSKLTVSIHRSPTSRVATSVDDIGTQRYGNRHLMSLSLLRRQLQMVGGHLELQPNAANWESARVMVPVRDTAVAEAQRDTTDNDAQGASYAGMALLLVEDDELTRLLTTRILERNGARVTQAETAAEAVDHLRKQRFDLIIADLNLPDLSGVELLRHLRSVDRITPVIVVSTSLGTAPMLALAEAAPDQLLGKPLRDDELRLAVSLLIAAGRLVKP